MSRDKRNTNKDSPGSLFTVLFQEEEEGLARLESIRHPQRGKGTRQETSEFLGKEAMQSCRAASGSCGMPTAAEKLG
jgi:endonuclease YncB( thermonuclease family)